MMAKSQTVKARKHPGSNSLDLTVPSRICSDYDVQPGDIFEVDSVVDRGEVKLMYKRVYRKR
jgi:hypothetical protein